VKIIEPNQVMEPAQQETMEKVLGLIREERGRQFAQYGSNEEVQDGTGPKTAWLAPLAWEPAEDIQTVLRADYEDFEEETGSPTWVHLVREEIAEAFQEDDDESLAAELVQVAALCASWVERIMARNGGAL
jgi:hypothetical protein